jgi:hypothetical protein
MLIIPVVVRLYIYAICINQSLSFSPLGFVPNYFLLDLEVKVTDEINS